MKQKQAKLTKKQLHSILKWSKLLYISIKKVAYFKEQDQIILKSRIMKSISKSAAGL